MGVGWIVAAAGVKEDPGTGIGAMQLCQLTIEDLGLPSWLVGWLTH